MLIQTGLVKPEFMNLLNDSLKELVHESLAHELTTIVHKDNLNVIIYIHNYDAN